MIGLIGYYWYGLLLALLIGMATGWWIWADRPVIQLAEFEPDDEPVEWAQSSMGAPPPVVTPPMPKPLPVEEVEENDPIDTAASEPTALAESAVPAEQDSAPNDLMTIKGIGPELEEILHSLGINRFAQIAAWMPEDIERIDGELGIFRGSILRDEWIGQARLLAKGDMETFNQRYGHL